MKRRKFSKLILSLAFIVAFFLWTLAVCFIDVKPIGPNNSSVGFSKLNGWAKELIGTRLWLYVITDWLGLVPFAVSLAFAALGLVQWIKRKNILKVDFDILMLGVFYVIVFSVYVLFEYLVINCRPILINGYLEASYPSSTTMLVACVMPTAIMQINSRIKCKKIKNLIAIIIMVFIAFMVIGRLISGVHWASDIIGGLLFSIGVDLAYYALSSKI